MDFEELLARSLRFTSLHELATADPELFNQLWAATKRWSDIPIMNGMRKKKDVFDTWSDRQVKNVLKAFKGGVGDMQRNKNSLRQYCQTYRRHLLPRAGATYFGFEQVPFRERTAELFIQIIENLAIESGSDARQVLQRHKKLRKAVMNSGLTDAVFLGLGIKKQKGKKQGKKPKIGGALPLLGDKTIRFFLDLEDFKCKKNGNTEIQKRFGTQFYLNLAASLESCGCSSDEQDILTKLMSGNGLDVADVCFCEEERLVALCSVMCLSSEFIRRHSHHLREVMDKCPKFLRAARKGGIAYSNSPRHEYT